jgi:hypothetical protein
MWKIQILILTTYIKAHFTLEVSAKKNLGPTLNTFELQIGPQVT